MLKKSETIKPLIYSFAGPVIVVGKKNETIKLCIDYKKLNAINKCTIVFKNRKHFLFTLTLEMFYNAKNGNKL